MQNIFRSLLLFTLFFNVHIKPIIFESSDLKDIYRYADKSSIKNSIIVFDIDDTITEMQLGLGPLIGYKIAEIQKKGFSKKETFELVLPLLFTITNFTPLAPIGNSPDIIKNLQKEGICVMGLTKRSIPVAKSTINYLKNIGINFCINNLYDNDLKISVTHTGLFSQGILFSGYNNKGKILFSFFEKIGYLPQKIIFIDDQLKNIKAVEKEAEKRGVEFIGIRFSLQDAKRKNFDLSLSKKNFHDLKVKLGLEPLF